MVMRAIIYNTKAQADSVNESLAELNHKPIEYIGSGVHVEPTPIPYTQVIKHPNQNKWALMTTSQIETFLNIEGQELTSDWINNQE
jgi:hypothetical protein